MLSQKIQSIQEVFNEAKKDCFDERDRVASSASSDIKHLVQAESSGRRFTGLSRVFSQH